jgi:hypothetical protein
MFIDITNMNIEINNKIYQCFYDRSNDYPYIILDNKRKYFKKCDKCKIIQLYGLKLDMIRQINKKSKCKSCRDYSGEKNPMYGKKHTSEIKEKISKINTGRILSDEHKEKISNKIKGKNHPMYGKKHTDESKNKIRGNISNYLLVCFKFIFYVLLCEYSSLFLYSADRIDHMGFFHHHQISYFIRLSSDS